MTEKVKRYCDCGKRLYSTKSQEAGKCYKCDKRTGYQQNKQGLPPRIKKFLAEDRRQRVLRLVRDEGAVTVQQVISAIDEPASHRAIYSDLRELRSRGLVDKTVGQHPSGSGRASIWRVQQTP